MTTAPTPSSPETLELGITRFIDAAPEKLFRAWTEPELMKQWFCPPPWKVVHAECDVRPGGASLIVMQGPEGQQMPNCGVYLEVVPGLRLVFTDAYTEAWVPSPKPFMTGILSFDPEGSGTRYTARVRHWRRADYDQHVAMGFEQGWGIATDQLAALTTRL
ncbi:SRPBCC family protein [Ottowia sp.]|uniref:SRPBCC family protein n=1 Tax=Ottowia sp. TaxID=1898956 RepID=UPI0026172200|nr:SRPBCC family protein [Ottowia sp.]